MFNQDNFSRLLHTFPPSYITAVSVYYSVKYKQTIAGKRKSAKEWDRMHCTLFLGQAIGKCTKSQTTDKLNGGQRSQVSCRCKVDVQGGAISLRVVVTTKKGYLPGMQAVRWAARQLGVADCCQQCLKRQLTSVYASQMAYDELRNGRLHGLSVDMRVALCLCTFRQTLCRQWTGQREELTERRWGGEKQRQGQGQAV